MHVEIQLPSEVSKILHLLVQDRAIFGGLRFSKLSSGESDYFLFVVYDKMPVAKEILTDN